jgi:hypothetical protein
MGNQSPDVSSSVLTMGNQSPNLSSAVVTMGNQGPNLSSAVVTMGNQSPNLSSAVVTMGNQSPNLRASVINAWICAISALHSFSRSVCSRSVERVGPSSPSGCFMACISLLNFSELRAMRLIFCSSQFCQFFCISWSLFEVNMLFISPVVDTVNFVTLELLVSFALHLSYDQSDLAHAFLLDLDVYCHLFFLDSDATLQGIN